MDDGGLIEYSTPEGFLHQKLDKIAEKLETLIYLLERIANKE